MSTATVTCPLCEATCGLQVTLDGQRITEVRGDDKDVFSAGFICPKGASLRALHEDPDRLQQPLIKRNGMFEPASWDEAFAEIDRRLPPLIAKHGKNAVAVYAGNPTSHNLAALLAGRRAQCAHGQPRPRGRRDVPARRRRSDERADRAQPRVHPRPLAQPGTRPA